MNPGIDREAKPYRQWKPSRFRFFLSAGKNPPSPSATRGRSRWSPTAEPIDFAYPPWIHGFQGLVGLEFETIAMRLNGGNGLGNGPHRLESERGSWLGLSGSPRLKESIVLTRAPGIVESVESVV